MPIVIEPIHDGIYGYRTKATIPPIAGGYGVPISGIVRIGKKWTYKGRHYSYVNARCETGKLQAKGEFTLHRRHPARRHLPQALHGAGLSTHCLRMSINDGAMIDMLDSRRSSRLWLCPGLTGEGPSADRGIRRASGWHLPAVARR